MSEATIRMAAGVEYDGRAFCGWQSQYAAGLRTVQGEVESALSRIANHRIKVYCAGRTDTGVHALGQVIHFDTHAQRELRSWLLGTNSFLPGDVKLTWAKPVADHFHARFLAVGRSYRYLVHNHPARSALWNGRVFEWPTALDVDAMSEAANKLVGWNDFSSFRGKDCQAKTPVKLMRHVAVHKHHHWVAIDVEASGFLHNMVRNIVGTLLEIGAGAKPVSWMDDVLQARDRRAAGQSAPPHGLYFMRADFPDEFDLPHIVNDAFLL
ncbi:tRNA pseudouridine(38-40) synthase TruA [Oceanococcus atlanticus]|nr:tRNA pseudouridine(38-40) synthase TruA [Oceanococcus atlanticus]